MEAGILSQLHRVTAHGSGSSRHGQGLTRFERQLVERQTDRQSVHWNGRGLSVARPGRNPYDRLDRHHDAFGVCPMLTQRDHDRHDALPDPEIRVDASADLLKHPRCIHTRNMGWPDVLQSLRPTAAPQHRVSGIDRGSVHPQTQLARTGFRIRQLNLAKDLWPAEFHDPYCPHDDPGYAAALTKLGVRFLGNHASSASVMPGAIRRQPPHRRHRSTVSVAARWRCPAHHRATPRSAGHPRR